MFAKYFSLIALLGLFTSCATRYILPGNRFMTPETQGEVLRGQFEIQQGSANILSINTKNSSVEDGVLYRDIQRTSYQYSNSLFDPFDIFLAHTGSSNTVFGGKFQFLGGSRVSKSAGHKASFSAGIGENKHTTENKAVKFNLRAQENFLIYGYRFSEFVMPYGNVSYSKYRFDGKISHSNPSLNGTRPGYETIIVAGSVGVELSYAALVSKLECTYQQLDTNKTKEHNRFIFGYSLGVAW